MGPELTRPRRMPTIIPINTIEKEDPRCVRGARSATTGTRIQGESLAAADEKGEDFEEKQIGGQCEAQGQECGHKKRGGDELASVDSPKGLIGRSPDACQVMSYYNGCSGFG